MSEWWVQVTFTASCPSWKILATMKPSCKICCGPTINFSIPCDLWELDHGDRCRDWRRRTQSQRNDHRLENGLDGFLSRCRWLLVPRDLGNDLYSVAGTHWRKWFRRWLCHLDHRQHRVTFRSGSVATSRLQTRVKLVTTLKINYRPSPMPQTVLGVTVIGALIPSVVKATVPFVYKKMASNWWFKTRWMPSLPSPPIFTVLLTYWMLGQKKPNSTSSNLDHLDLVDRFECVWYFGLELAVTTDR